MVRRDREIWVGDLIEFQGAHDCDGILTNMIDQAGEEWEIIPETDQHLIKAIVVHQIVDGKFAVHKTDSLPGRFIVTHKDKWSIN